MYILANACKDASFMTVMLLIKKLVDIIFIIAPILLIILLTIDFSKAVIEGSEDKINHIKEISIKRILFAIVLLFVPLIVDTSFSLLPENKSKIIDCYNNASQSNVNKLVEKANAKKEKQENKAEQRLKKIRKKQEQEAKKRAKNAEEARKKWQQKNGSGGACINCKMGEKIAQTAENLAWAKGSSSSKYYIKEGGGPTPLIKATVDKYYPSWAVSNYKKAACCCHSTRVILANVVGKWVGNLLPNTTSKSGAKKELEDSVSKFGFQVIAWDGKESSLRRGDIVSFARRSGGGHVYTYVGKSTIIEGSYGSSETDRKFSHYTTKDLNVNPNNYYYIYVIRYKE